MSLRVYIFLNRRVSSAVLISEALNCLGSVWEGAGAEHRGMRGFAQLSVAEVTWEMKWEHPDGNRRARWLRNAAEKLDVIASAATEFLCEAKILFSQDWGGHSVLLIWCSHADPQGRPAEALTPQAQGTSLTDIHRAPCAALKGRNHGQSNSHVASMQCYFCVRLPCLYSWDNIIFSPTAVRIN